MQRNQATRAAKQKIAGDWKSDTWRVGIHKGIKLTLSDAKANISVQIYSETDDMNVSIPGSWEVRTWPDITERHGFEYKKVLDLDEALDVVERRIIRQIAALQALLPTKINLP